SAPSCESLELDAMNFVVALASEDAVFDFDVDDATPAPVAGATAPAEEQPPEVAASSTPDPFAAYVAAVVEVAQVAGHTRAAAALPLLLEGAEFDAAVL